jgi:UDP-N-acetylmuramoyl-tripeptide--D-alanyl-D-alanine ligase
VKPRRLSDVARAVDGRLQGEDADVISVVTDSRLVDVGALFVALPGTRTDGSRFVFDAFANGASGVLVHEDLDVDVGPVVSVRSTGAALLQLAADERSRSDATIVGITGANGKTSTKDMTAAIVASRFRTYASPQSSNNEIGLPMTLLGAPPDVEIIVAEMGARRVGDVAALCRIARPQLVAVTNVGVAHLEIFGSWDRIVEASAEPVRAIEPDGVAILNADDPVASRYSTLCRGRVVTFGIGAPADIRAEGVSLGPDGCATFDLVGVSGRARLQMPIPGEHMVPNALAATAIGTTLGIDIVDCAAAISQVSLSRWRMETFTTSAGVCVVNDAYNANPESMVAALKTARWMAGHGQLIAVLGTMAELGPITEQEHERLGELAARIRVDRLITVGDTARAIATAGLREGVEPQNVASYDDPDGALEDVRRAARPGDVVLFKASRVAGLEKLAEALR